MDNNTLRKLQLVETEILEVVARFCEKHDIKYSLHAGTLLGAVRHGGFIPWDDDVDIFMERNEYNRFLELWEKENVEGYYLQGTNKPDYSGISHTKIRKDRTILASSEEMKENCHHGIWIDVFPLEKIPTDKKKRKKFLFKAKLHIVYTRGYPFTKGSAFLKLVSKILLLPSRKRQLKIRNKLEKQIVDGYKDLTSGYEYISPSSPGELRFIYPAEVIENYSTITFEGKTFSTVKDYDKMLAIQFGDYMQLPPEEERVCKHNPEVLKF